jgi:peptide chain release factor 1
LISDSGGNTSEEGRHFRAGLGESENVVDEKEHILSLFISEVLGNGQTSKSDTGTCTWGFVHLSVDEGSLGLVTFHIDDIGLNHFVVEIVTFTGTFSDTGENRVTTMGFGDVVNQFHNKYGLSDSSTTEESNLTSSGVGGK